MLFLVHDQVSMQCVNGVSISFKSTAVVGCLIMPERLFKQSAANSTWP